MGTSKTMPFWSPWSKPPVAADTSSTKPAGSRKARRKRAAAAANAPKPAGAPEAESSAGVLARLWAWSPHQWLYPEPQPPTAIAAHQTSQPALQTPTAKHAAARPKRAPARPPAVDHVIPESHTASSVATDSSTRRSPSLGSEASSTSAQQSPTAHAPNETDWQQHAESLTPLQRLHMVQRRPKRGKAIREAGTGTAPETAKLAWVCSLLGNRQEVEALIDASATAAPVRLDPRSSEDGVAFVTAAQELWGQNGATTGAWEQAYQRLNQLGTLRRGLTNLRGWVDVHEATPELQSWGAHGGPRRLAELIETVGELQSQSVTTRDNALAQIKSDLAAAYTSGDPQVLAKEPHGVTVRKFLASAALTAFNAPTVDDAQRTAWAENPAWRRLLAVEKPAMNWRFYIDDEAPVERVAALLLNNDPQGAESIAVADKTWTLFRYKRGASERLFVACHTDTNTWAVLAHMGVDGHIGKRNNSYSAAYNLELKDQIAALERQLAESGGLPRKRQSWPDR